MKARALILTVGLGVAVCQSFCAYGQTEGLTNPDASLAAPAPCAFPKVIDYPANASECGASKGLGVLPYKFGQSFDMKATFNAPAASCGYRQQIKGKLEYLDPTAPAKVAVKVPFPLPPGKDKKKVELEENTFHEDGVTKPDEKNNANFGHRDQGDKDVNDVYDTPNRATGTEYKGHDIPGLNYNDAAVTRKVQITVDLTFEGSILDTSTNKTVDKTTKTWNVKCSGVATKPAAPGEEDNLSDFGEPQVDECAPILQAETATNLSDGTPVIVALTVCAQTPEDLIAVVSAVDSGSRMPLNASEVSLAISPLSMSPLGLLYGPSGTLLETENKYEKSAFGVYWFDFSQPGYDLDVQLSVRGSRVEFMTTLQ